MDAFLLKLGDTACPAWVIAAASRNHSMHPRLDTFRLLDEVLSHCDHVFSTSQLVWLEPVSLPVGSWLVLCCPLEILFLPLVHLLVWGFSCSRVGHCLSVEITVFFLSCNAELFSMDSKHRISETAFPNRHNSRLVSCVYHNWVLGTPRLKDLSTSLSFPLLSRQEERCRQCNQHSLC